MDEDIGSLEHWIGEQAELQLGPDGFVLQRRGRGQTKFALRGHVNIGEKVRSAVCSSSWGWQGGFNLPSTGSSSTDILRMPYRQEST